MAKLEKGPQPGLKAASVTPTTLIIEQSAHCDWDWVATFSQYYYPGGGGHSAVQEILTNAISYLTATTNPIPYIYAFCEMAYLQQFLASSSQPSPWTLPAGFNVSTGGITSADNLLTHGETFIRNYLIGRQWIHANLNVIPSDYMWVPDDFGHDAQLPIVLQAMGFRGAGFWRIPVNAPNAPSANSSAPSSKLQNTGVDFTWKAADGSSIQAHWLLNSYCQGNNALGSDADLVWGSTAQTDINTLVQESLGSPSLPQPTPYMFVPVDCDFSLPYTNLADIVYQWNQCNSQEKNCYGTNPSYTEGITVFMSTFAEFMDRVSAYNQENASLSVYVADQSPQAWVPNPYYSGTYGSQPALKRLHYKTTRTLLFAEAMEILLEYLANTSGGNWIQTASTARDRIASAWNSLMPSSHHDYITGTAGIPQGQTGTNYVYAQEQLPDLINADLHADEALRGTLTALAEAIKPDQSEAAVAVFNPLAIPREDIAEMPVGVPSAKYASSTMDGVRFTPVQYTAEGKLLFMAEAPSMGYSCVNLSNTTATDTPVLSIRKGNGDYVLSNKSLSATVSLASPTGIIALVDQSTQSNIINGIGNQVVFYRDEGNIYRFGNELSGSYDFYADSSVQLEDAEFVEPPTEGALCVSVTVKAQVQANGQTIPYRIRYALFADEPFLRMELSGAAPRGYSVMLRFPLASATGAAPVQALTYGTPCHWDTRQPRNYYDVSSTSTVEQICFEPTHNFVLPLDANDNILGAIYHASTPGWAIDPQQSVLGCILRNVPNTQNAAWASDPDQHTVAYALRIPSGLTSPQAGCGFTSPLGESLRFNNSMRGVSLPANNRQGSLPATMSIAGIRPAADGTKATRALITAAKAGTMNPSDLIFRVYQPTNVSLSDVTVELATEIASLYQDTDVLNVIPQTALETAAKPSPGLDLTPALNAFTFNQQFALATFALKPAPGT